MKKIIIILITFLLVTGIKLNSENDRMVNKEKNLLKNNATVDLRIKKLELYANDTKVDFDFNPDVKSYKIVLPDSRMDVLNFKTELFDSNAYFLNEYSDANYYKCRNEKCVINFGVTCSIGDEMTYTLEIVKPQGVATNSRLSYLKINNKEVKLTDELKYLVVLGKNEQKVEVEAIADTEGIDLEYNDMELVNGENEFTITLVDKENIKLDYNITILKVDVDDDKLLDYKNNNLRIKKIYFDGNDLEFDSNKYNYDIVVDDPTKIPSFTIEPNSVKYEQLVEGKKDGNKKLVLKVLDDCETKTYTFNFISDSIQGATINSKINTNILYYVFFGISVLLLILSILYAIKGRSKSKKAINISEHMF